METFEVYKKLDDLYKEITEKIRYRADIAGTISAVELEAIDSTINYLLDLHAETRKRLRMKD